MTSDQIRETFLTFFEGKGHSRVPSAPVVPHDDPTLYFTNAGMNQFKDVFLGLGSRPYTRAVDTQKCIRVSGKHNDLEEVGFSPWHHTLFEMLGNWSFGDYFKREAIEWGWELVTEKFGLERERLWATVYEGSESEGVEPDEAAEKLWGEVTDLLPGRVIRLPAKENFWEMGATGPCGPCSEIHYYVGDDLSLQTPELFLEDGPEFVEFWNLVFIQYNRDETGALHPLPAQHVDTGMGFERICSLLQKKDNNYDTDVFRPLIERIGDLTGGDVDGDGQVAARVVADHIRSLSCAIADGALPSNEGRGYVLRRILRRASRYGRQLGQHEPFIHQLVGHVADTMGHVFPELPAKAAHIAQVLKSEEESFGKTLDRGLDIFERLAAKGDVSGADAFQLYDTFGFPLDLTELMARERNLSVDTEGFEAALEQQRQRARAAAGSRFQATEGVGDVIAGEHSRFIGYDELETETSVAHVAADGDALRLVLEATPFYAESGGQVGDCGTIEGDGYRIRIETTQKGRGGIVHVGRLVDGEVPVAGVLAQARVDAQARDAAARHHTATHLLHEALRRTLGDHVDQMGSLVSPERLRFDFSHFSAVEPDQLRQIEDIVNEAIRADLEIETFEEELDRARELGARALFGEKYGERVRVVKMADFSLELCGGTHLVHTGQIGAFELTSEGGIATGTRRVEATGGAPASDLSRANRERLGEVGHMLNATAEEVPQLVRQLLDRNRDLEKALTEARRQAATDTAGDLLETAIDIDGLRLVSARVDVEDVPSLRSMADGLRDRLGSGVAVLGGELQGKVCFIAVVTDDLIKQRSLKAGDVVKGVAQLAGGSGGGKPHMAQAGGKDAGQIDAALAAAPDIVRGLLAV
ncbi:MAG: alanine--tRNA ligase [Gemmatimonadetes bacterium]|nr:alanine--tRNA ligase [Gemmatimonadota bacterium]MBT7862917.1 alanine--tRNA ligase [Gemmatimonadota bacterium]